MLITKLEYQKKDPNRVSIYVDGKFTVGIGVDAVLRLGLVKNQEITQEELNKIIGESDFGKLLNKAINFISFRPRSEWEIRRKFNNEDLITKLKKLNLINDEEFTKWFIEQRNTFRNKSARAIEHELAMFGIKTKISPKNDEEQALVALRKRFKKTADPVKMQNFLLSRGFNWDTIKEAIKNQKEVD